MERKNEYHVIGIMSGTSLDGLDIALCTFRLDGTSWLFSIEKGVTYSYSEDWKLKLATAESLSGYQLMLLNNDFGQYIGDRVCQFLKGMNLPVDFIASHGHTIFHQPQVGLTLQIGNGASVAASTGITTVCDFRTMDVALGGQGAPLVPIGDKLLFSRYRYCLNLGGFANVSFDDEKGARIAFDICPVNIVLNHFAREKGLDYDLNGGIGRQGVVQNALLRDLNNLEYYQLKGPKSLGKEWVWEDMLPILNSNGSISMEDKMRTIYEHIAIQISSLFEKRIETNLLITGGGAYNKFLIELLKEKLALKVEIPDKNLVDFKEALIFAFLGLLRYRNEINCLSSVTGATRDSVAGVIFNVQNKGVYKN